VTGIAFIDALFANPVFAGVGGAAVVSALLYQARALPGQIYFGLRKALLVELEIDNSQRIYDELLALISQLDSVRRARRLKLVEQYDFNADTWQWVPTIGRGFHLLRDGLTWMVVEREIMDDSKGEMLRPRERLTLMLVGRDTGLQAAFNQVPNRGIAVIEDIDANEVTHHRDFASTKASMAALEPEKQVTLSGLLNAIDGVGARDGRILFITSNHASQLDTALLRPGRVDCREEIGLIEVEEAEAMARLHLAKFSQKWFDDHIRSALPMAPAALQQILLRGFEAQQRGRGP
jgi:SpoVK/Ycf46/Vps4 family AAA+-type ATPase